ncbi:MAG: HDIG domain-containing metalloprotein [Candidatus Moraniibacteriota bacterium]
MEAAGLLQFIIPELREGIGVTQNLHHIYTVWEHNVRALATCPSRKLSVRLAALLHDVAKPRTKRGEGYRSTFYNHDHVGARMTRVILTRMRYPRAVVEKATLLVDNHLFYYNVDEVTEASVRRLVKRVGLQNMDDLMAVRIGDRLGSGVPKAKPYKLRHLEYMIEKVSQDPLSAKMLALKGTDSLRRSLFQPARRSVLCWISFWRKSSRTQSVIRARRFWPARESLLHTIRKNCAAWPSRPSKKRRLPKKKRSRRSTM